MKKLLGILLCSSAVMFGAERAVQRCGAFDISLPGKAADWAVRVNRFDALESTKREAGWIVVAASKNLENTSINQNVCMQLAVNMPNRISYSDQFQGMTVSPGEALQRYVTQLNSAYANNYLGLSDGSSRMAAVSLVVFMKYGNTLMRAIGNKAADQSNWVPDVQYHEEAFPEAGDVALGDNTPFIRWIRARAAAEGPSSSLIALLKSCTL